MKLLALIFIAVLGLLAYPAYADLYPYYLDPSVCNPPAPPQPGEPGYTSGHPLPNGTYYDPTTGFWHIPEGVWQGGEGERLIEIIDEIQELLTRPSWATEPPVNGQYWFNGGFGPSGNWYEPGYYFPYEIF